MEEQDCKLHVLCFNNVLFLLFSLCYFMFSCCFIACPNPPSVPHAFITDGTKKAEYQQGDVIHLICETGYISGPMIKYACTNEGWFAVRQGTCICKLILLHTFRQPKDRSRCSQVTFCHYFYFTLVKEIVVKLHA